MTGQILTTSPASAGPVASGASVSGAGEAPARLLSAWALLSEAVAREFGPQAALVLAEPRDEGSGIICWHTSLEGGSCPISILKGHERAVAARILRERAGEFAGLATRLSSDPSDASWQTAGLLSRLSAALAARAAGIPGPETVYVVDGLPVLTRWDASVSAGDAAFATPVPLAPPVAPPVPLTPPAAAVPLSLLAAAAGAPDSPAEAPQHLSTPPVPQHYAPAQPAAGAGASDRAGALRMLLAALGAFLLVLLLFSALSPGFRKAVGSLSAGVPPPRPDYGVEAGLREELASLKDLYLDSLAVCRPEEPRPPLAEERFQLPDPEAWGLEPPPSSGDGLSAALEAVPPPPPPPPPPETKPKPKPEAPPRPGRDDGQPKPKPGSRLTIPDKPTDMAFLQGCWRSDAGIYSSGTKQPLYVYYCFKGSSGDMTVRVEELDPSGRVRTVCTTTGKARLAGRGIVIRDNGAKCPAGHNDYVPDTVECSPASGGAARCTLQSDGGRKLQTRITYQGG